MKRHAPPDPCQAWLQDAVIAGRAREPDALRTLTEVCQAHVEEVVLGDRRHWRLTLRLAEVEARIGFLRWRVAGLVPFTSHPVANEEVRPGIVGAIRIALLTLMCQRLERRRDALVAKKAAARGAHVASGNRALAEIKHAFSIGMIWANAEEEGQPRLTHHLKIERREVNGN